ncbi:Gfo/Idh/MocA family oxidoreductase [Paenibacillus sp. CGMCC 1.16610]|uniref:Gfo/Idh/MocA family oxidoreductase n=1 Tax=Paenibacillus anseongense TaxID=2682845 RepID=A0ABW9U5U8_9BACL|nr:Gfo/Idh/MocA family oxidoreductase [Paenibacillus sp. CGMCC 1.16610]MBA2940302.1 Gfo/Idh/MocA family oxidoreductase [Paenibacillus sp. CGMCC 1.16610]MVQ35479.1 gfo/Idh/MocA family oxidoreductase [Paenibacillus anseongense]
MKAILVGLGSAGFSWYKRLRDQGLLAAVVEVDAAMKEKMQNDPFPFYTSLEEALQKEQADFLVNVTSPMVHTVVNHAAFDRKLAVLCEKPISFNYEESIEVVARAEREKLPFMIAENYRRMPHIRKMKQLLDEGVIGSLSSMDVQFYRFHNVQRRYTVSILDDIGVHHFDLFRYFSGREGKTVQAKLYNPINAWDQDGAIINAYAFLEMDNGITASYNASISARGTETPWSGNWRLEGTEGAIEYVDKEIRVIRDGEVQRIEDYSGIDLTDTLAEFLASLREGRESETSGRDYLKTQALVHYAKLASEFGKTYAIPVPTI